MPSMKDTLKNEIKSAKAKNAQHRRTKDHALDGGRITRHQTQMADRKADLGVPTIGKGPKSETAIKKKEKNHVLPMKPKASHATGLPILRKI